MSSTNMPKRPDKGGAKGKQIQVKANIFKASLPDVTFYHYDVAITPEVPPPKARLVWQQAEVLMKETLKENVFLAYDGQKSAYGVKNLADMTFSLHTLREPIVLLPPIAQGAGGSSGRGGRGGSSSRGGRGGSSSRGGSVDAKAPSMTWKLAAKVEEKSKLGETEKFKIVIRKVATLNFHELLQFAQGKGMETDNVLNLNNTLSIVLRHVPSMLFTPVQQNFFTPEGRIPMMGGLEIWRGYHQSVKAMMAGHLGINIDLASCVFRKGSVSVIDYLVEVLNLRDANQLSTIPNANKRISEEMKGISVCTTHRADARHRFKIAKFNNETPNSYIFETETSDGKKVKTNVTKYFKDQYKINLKYPNLPIAWKANGKTGFPLECLEIAPSQRYNKKLSPDQTSDMIKATTQKPVDRQRNIQEAVDNTLKYANNPYMESFGFKVDTQMMTVPARILPAPNVVFKGGKTASGQEGAWNLTKFKLIDAPMLESFAFIFFVKLGHSEAIAIRNKIVAKWQETGMNIKSNNVPVLVCNPNSPAAVRTALISAFKDCQAKLNKRSQLLVCIIDKSVPTLYATIKKIALTEAGVITQCMLSKHVINPDEIKDQYISNVALKANIKIGGATNHVSALGTPSDMTLFMGADVTHAHPGSNAPSIAAVVASVDNACTRYHTYIRAQGHREEIIVDMEKIMAEALVNYQKANQGKSPKRVMFFRDGVASGQFDKVQSVEIRGILVALHAAKLKIPVTFMVVQKRHHVRFFPTDGTMDRSGNCMPGTVIDTTITHPTEFNFYLQSHAGIQGMSRGTLYHVLHDDQKFTSDALQGICFSLCFLAERATRSIGMVAPAYRAHIAAFYARMFLEESSGSVSASSGGSLTSVLKPVAAGIQSTMYYM